MWSSFLVSAVRLGWWEYNDCSQMRMKTTQTVICVVWTWYDLDLTRSDPSTASIVHRLHSLQCCAYLLLLLLHYDYYCGILSMCPRLLRSQLRAAGLPRMTWSNTLFTRRCLKVLSKVPFCSIISAWYMSQMTDAIMRRCEFCRSILNNVTYPGQQ